METQAFTQNIGIEFTLQSIKSMSISSYPRDHSVIICQYSLLIIYFLCKGFLKLKIFIQIPMHWRRSNSNTVLNVNIYEIKPNNKQRSNYLLSIKEWKI